MSVSLPTMGIMGGTAGIATEGMFGPYTVPIIGSVTVDTSVVPDNGGVIIEATGIFPTTEGVRVTVTDGGSLSEVCWGGIVGGGNYRDATEGGTKLKFVVPPLPIGGPYSLLFEAVSLGSFVAPNVLTVIHRSGTTPLYGLRSAQARPRDVGPYSIHEED